MNRRCSIPGALLILLLTFLHSTSGQGINLSDVPLPTTPAEANGWFHARAMDINYYNACKNDTLGDLQIGGLDFITVAIARLEYAKQGKYCNATDMASFIQSVNQALLAFNPNDHQDWALGSSVDQLGCKRKGEKDVSMAGLITMMYRYPNALQTPVAGTPQTAYDHVLNDILKPSISGPHQDLSHYIACGIPFPETENHLLLIESSRYLTNQLFRQNHSEDSSFDNGANGYNSWMLQYLKVFLQNDFSEYNSRPYQTYSMLALQNLYDFAPWENVGMAARMVLDYVSAKFAVSSNGLRRFAPYRRRKSHYDTKLFDGFIGSGDYPQSDPQTFRFMVLAGITTKAPALGSDFGGPEGGSMMQFAAVTNYRVPDLILDLMINHEHASYYQRIHHAADEIYASSPKYLITAGGKWIPGAFSDQCNPGFIGVNYCGDEYNHYEDVGMELPTTLMPTAEGIDATGFVQIFSQPRGVNDCVAPGFACGQFLLIPMSYLQGCSTAVDGSGLPNQSGPWFFIDASGHCPGGKSLGLYIAAYGKAATRLQGLPPSEVPQGPPIWVYQEPDYLTEVAKLSLVDAGIGFFEVASSDSMEFPSFQQRVLSQNRSTNFGSNDPTHQYVTVGGTKIVFAGGHASPNVILSIGGRQELNENAEPLAQGDIINSDGHSGLIEIDNPFTDQSLVLDFRSALNPQESSSFASPPDFPSLPPCGTPNPRFTPGYHQENSDWVGIWGDTGVNTDRDRIVVRIAATETPGIFDVSTLERAAEAGFPDLKMVADGLEITSTSMPLYKTDHYAPPVSFAEHPSNPANATSLHPGGPPSGTHTGPVTEHPGGPLSGTPTGPAGEHPGGPLSGSSTGVGGVPSPFYPAVVLPLPNHVMLQVVLGCIPGKPAQGLYMRYFRSADDGQMLTDVMLIHSSDPPR